MSPGFIHQVHIADGFADDCEELIKRWLKTDTLTYETFCEIWKDMKFGCLYHGRTCGAEMAELSEELIHIAKHYMIANTSNFEESIAGVFLVYALVNLQPYPGFASLRIAPEDVQAIHRIETLARRQKLHDVLYILGSLLTEGPVQYHAAAREHGMESGIRKYLEGFTGIDSLGVRPRGVFFRQNEELDLLRELAVITKRYHHAKKAIAGENHRDLNYTSETLPTELDESLKRIISGSLERTTEVSEETTTLTRSMQAIKDKAMKMAVDGVRHLQSSVNKTKSPKKRTPKKLDCEIKQKPGKVRQQSPKKPVTSLAKRKRTGKLSKRKRKRKVSSSSSDLTTSSDESSINDYINKNGVNEKNKVKDVFEVNKSLDVNDRTSDINLESFSKDQSTVNEEVEEREIHIAIDSLPVFIREEQGGQMFEIEIIDKLKTKVKDEEIENAKKKAKNTKKFALKNVGKEENSSTAPGSSKDTEITENPGKSQKAEDPVDKKPVVANLKKPERRDLKKPVLRSKFKRMGMLDVADMKQNDNATTKKD